MYNDKYYLIIKQEPKKIHHQLSEAIQTHLLPQILSHPGIEERLVDDFKDLWSSH